MTIAGMGPSMVSRGVGTDDSEWGAAFAAYFERLQIASTPIDNMQKSSPSPAVVTAGKTYAAAVRAQIEAKPAVKKAKIGTPIAQRKVIR